MQFEKKLLSSVNTLTGLKVKQCTIAIAASYPNQCHFYHFTVAERDGGCSSCSKKLDIRFANYRNHDKATRYSREGSTAYRRS